jgi:hypothetical protein
MGASGASTGGGVRADWLIRRPSGCSGSRILLDSAAPPSPSTALSYLLFRGSKRPVGPLLVPNALVLLMLWYP